VSHVLNKYDNDVSVLVNSDFLSATGRGNIVFKVSQKNEEDNFVVTENERGLVTNRHGR
jgi:hypothetical protein